MFNSIKSSISKLKIDKLHLCFLHQDDIEIISDKYIQQGIKLLKERERERDYLINSFI